MKNKLFGILAAVALVLSLMLIPASAVLAADPTVSITTTSDRIVSGVNGNFGTGTLNYTFAAITPTHTATTTMTNMTGASLVVGASAFDITTWHPGQIGETNTLNANGAFSGTYQNSTNGNFGAMSTFVNANAEGGVNTQFLMNSSTDLHVLSATSGTGVLGNFYANAIGTNAAMNLKSISWGASPGGWQEATNPYSNPPLQGQIIEKCVGTSVGGVPNSQLYLGVVTSGTATMSNSNIWGWGINNTGQSTTNYAGGTRSLSATGTGVLNQTAFGLNNLNFNANYTMPGGGSTTPTGLQFNNGISGTYSMDGK